MVTLKATPPPQTRERKHARAHTHACTHPPTHPQTCMYTPTHTQPHTHTHPSTSTLSQMLDQSTVSLQESTASPALFSDLLKMLHTHAHNTHTHKHAHIPTHTRTARAHTHSAVNTARKLLTPLLQSSPPSPPSSHPRTCTYRTRTGLGACCAGACESMVHASQTEHGGVGV